MRIFSAGRPAYRLILIVVFALFVRGCGEVGTGAPAGSNLTTTQPAPSLGKLYIANSGGRDLLFHNQAVRALGNVPPSGQLSAGLAGPVGVFLDKANDRLFVADPSQNSVVIFDQVSQPTPSIRTLSGVATQINRPFGLFVDTTRNLLYVANTNNGTRVDIILASGQSSGSNSETTLNDAGAPFIPNELPGQTLKLVAGKGAGQSAVIVTNTASQITIAAPWSVIPDATTSYQIIKTKLENVKPGNILIFGNADTVQGNTAPSRALGGPATTLDFPRAVFVDTVRNHLYISNAGANSILVFERASTRNGNVKPDRILQPPVPPTDEENKPSCNQDLRCLSLPFGIFVDSSADRLYVANTGRNQSSILVFENASEKGKAGQESPKPDKVLIGNIIDEQTEQIVSSSLIADPVGIDYDAATDTLYVTNQGDVSIKENVLASGQSTGLNTSTTLNDAQAAYTPNEWAGKILRLVGGTGKGQERTILSNTDKQFTIQRAWSPIPVPNPNGPPALPDSTTQYEVVETLEILLAAGQSTGPNSLTTLDDTLASYIPDQWVGQTLRLVGGTGGGQERTIVSNTATQFTILGTWAPLPDNTTLYEVVQLPAPAPLDSFVAFRDFNTRCPVSSSPCAIAPDISLHGTTSGLSDPSGVAVLGDLVYISNPGATPPQVTAYTLSNLSGPLKTLTGSLGLFDSVVNFISIALDSGRDILYAVDRGSVLSSDGAALALAPVSSLQSDLSLPGFRVTLAGLNNPQGVAVDAVRDTLYVADAEVLASGQSTGSNSPNTLNDTDAGYTPDQFAGQTLRLVAGGGSGQSATILSNTATQFTISDVWCTNPDRSTKYVVVSVSGNEIRVYGSASTLTGSVPLGPSLSNSVSDPRGLSVDQTNDTLYVANFGGKNVLAFSQASIASPSSPRIIGTNIGTPVAVAVDPNLDRLYVALSKEGCGTQTTTGTILVFENASLLDASSTPTFVVGELPGASDQSTPYFTFNDPAALFHDAQNDILYVADAGINALYAFGCGNPALCPDAAKLTKNSFPARTLVGSQTGLNRPTGVVVDPFR